MIHRHLAFAKPPPLHLRAPLTRAPQPDCRVHFATRPLPIGEFRALHLPRDRDKNATLWRLLDTKSNSRLLTALMTRSTGLRPSYILVGPCAASFPNIPNLLGQDSRVQRTNDQDSTKWSPLIPVIEREPVP